MKKVQFLRFKSLFAAYAFVKIKRAAEYTFSDHSGDPF